VGRVGDEQKILDAIAGSDHPGVAHGCIVFLDQGFRGGIDLEILGEIAQRGDDAQQAKKGRAGTRNEKSIDQLEEGSGNDVGQTRHYRVQGGGELPQWS